MNKAYEKLNNIYIWMYRLIVANILWIFFSLSGLVIVGIFPSTCALFALCRKWLMREEFSIYKTYKEYFKRDFKRANILGYIMLTIIAVLSVDYIYFLKGNMLLSLFLSYVFIFLLIFQLIAFAAMYAIYNHYEMIIKNYIKFIVLYPFGNLIMAAILTVAVVSVVYIIYILSPGFMIFLGMSLPVLIIVTITNINFNRMEEKQKKL